MTQSQRKMSHFTWSLIFIASALVWQGCAHQFALPEESRHAVYRIGPSEAPSDAMVRRWAPVFLTYGYADRYNRIGRPTVKDGQGEGHTIEVDPDQPTVYLMQRTFTTDKALYTNLIYRVHFPEVPFSLVPFNLTAGDNVGLMVVITLDQEHHPVLVTSVHTCGCYKAIVPTDFLPPDALPEGWALDQPLEVYGERLPSRLVYERIENPVLLLHIRPGVHRVMEIEVISADRLGSERYLQIPMQAAPMEALRRLPADGDATSFYIDEGWRKGYVKGSIKPFEMLFMSLISFDLFVGSDKIYADPAVSDNPFYTSLKPWRRKDSDMWDFAGFLHYWGWRL